MRALDQVLHHLKKTKDHISIGQLSEAEKSSTKIVKNIFATAPTLGIDIDGTIDESPNFYKMLSQVWPGAVLIVTLRQDIKKAEEYISSLGIHYDKIISVKKLNDKAEIIRQHNIDVFIDDQDECLMDIPQNVTVLKMRNPGNFDSGKWLYSDRTGQRI